VKLTLEHSKFKYLHWVAGYGIVVLVSDNRIVCLMVWLPK